MHRAALPARSDKLTAALRAGELATLGVMPSAVKDKPKKKDKSADARSRQESGKSAQKSKQKGKKGKKHAGRGWRTAARSDRHELYELSVQEPEADIDLVDQVWQELKGRFAVSVREDFCGTAVAAAEWVKRRPMNTAVGVDLDPEVLNWGRERLNDRLNDEQRSRITLLEADVFTVETEPLDCVMAMNFSYYLFKERKTLTEYFRRVRQVLKPGGMLLLDAYGGSEAFEELEEPRDMDGFTYIWDQSYYDPISGTAVNHIHFEFPDGTRMDKAFSYEWRLWTLPEIREMLDEAGFEKVTVYWEGTDEETDEGDGEWVITETGEACPGWVAYLAAEK